MSSVPPPPPPPAEEIVGYFDVVGTSVWTGVNETLFFTRSRVIVARLSSAASELLVQGGLIGWALEDRLLDKTRKKLLKYSAEDILRDNKRNYVIPNFEIVSASLEKKSLGRIKVTIETKKKAHSWWVCVKQNGKVEERHVEDFVPLMQIAAGNKIVVLK